LRSSAAIKLSPRGATLYVNYDFIEPEDPIKESELQEDEYIQTMTMTALLMLLEQQDKLF
jgi:hypothetical protein